MTKKSQKAIEYCKESKDGQHDITYLTKNGASRSTSTRVESWKKLKSATLYSPKKYYESPTHNQIYILGTCILVNQQENKFSFCYQQNAQAQPMGKKIELIN